MKQNVYQIKRVRKQYNKMMKRVASKFGNRFIRAFACESGGEVLNYFKREMP